MIRASEQPPTCWWGQVGQSRSKVVIFLYKLTSSSGIRQYIKGKKRGKREISTIKVAGNSVGLDPSIDVPYKPSL